MQPDELSSEAQRSSPRVAGEEEKVISTFEEAFRRIKEATGVTAIQVGLWKEAAVCMCELSRLFIFLFFMCSFVGDSTTLHLTEGDTPTSGEAERREREVAAGAERAEGAPEQRVPGHEVLWRS